MKKIALYLLLLIPFIMSSCHKKTNYSELKLHENWKFRNTASDQWLPASVPGCVHTDLMSNGEIEDPFYRLNEHDVQWIDKTDWEYETNFRFPMAIMEKDNIEICFLGLDTYADVYLNGKLILQADNMFREWKVNCKNVVTTGNNTLRIHFHSPVTIGLDKLDKLDYTFPPPPNDLSEIGGIGDKKVSIFTRKAGYHYGWDWGPRLVTSGIWKDVVLRGWNSAHIEDLYVHQDRISEHSAELTAQLDIAATEDAIFNLLGFVNDKEVLSTQVSLSPGNNQLSESFTIENPELWWSNGLGDQPLYEIDFKLMKENEVISRTGITTGLRTIEIVQEEEEEGKSFLFKVNGHPVFMKGANYIPNDVFLERVTPGDYEHIIQSAVDANMNMLRIWGGGIYEKDIFYELCDRKGILVWQDFMFACSMYPGDEEFLENIRHEAEDNVKRLRNHPCIALWCGNNECLSAWNSWGWKEMVADQQGQEVSDIIWKAYEDNYHRILPDVVSEYDPGRFYWSSSPSAGMGDPENWVAGDVHYWGVWWGKEPFSTYRTRACRFMSEYGFQSFPELNTVKKYAVEEDWDIYSEVMKSHQRSSIGNETIEYYLLQDYNKPKDFPMFLYVGQVLQAEGTRIAMEGHRKNMPYCMGSLLWQINDCWPVASWSTIDYYGNWKAQQYFAKKAFRDILISPQIDKDQVSVYVVSDRLENTEAVMTLRLMDFEGTVLWEKSENLPVIANSSRVTFSTGIDELISDPSDKNKVLLHCQLSMDGKVYSENILYFTPVKELELPVPGITWKLVEDGTGYKLRISTDKLAKNIYMMVEEEDVFFSDNYFDLLPGGSLEIEISSAGGLAASEIENGLSLISLVDSY